MNLTRWGLFFGALILSAQGQTLEVRNASGVRIATVTEDSNPALSVVVPGGPESERSSKILVPEHVTVRAHGQAEPKHLYIFRPGRQGNSPQWTKAGNALEYARDFGEIHFAARATLVEDGIVFRYEFANHSAIDYDMATAVTDPRFRTVFYDPRLERTYVHHKEGFDLLASETTARLTMPVNDWLPVLSASTLHLFQPSVCNAATTDHVPLRRGRWTPMVPYFSQAWWRRVARARPGKRLE